MASLIPAIDVKAGPNPPPPTDVSDESSGERTEHSDEQGGSKAGFAFAWSMVSGDKRLKQLPLSAERWFLSRTASTCRVSCRSQVGFSRRRFPTHARTLLSLRKRFFGMTYQPHPGPLSWTKRSARLSPTKKFLSVDSFSLMRGHARELCARPRSVAHPS